MNHLNSLEYRKAFNDYLRRGTPIRLSLKAEDVGHPYIWRTREDALVRSSHVENNGKIFAWDNPPATGNPGEAFGCRCTAEPYERGESEYAYQTLTSDIDDWPDKWGTARFVWHYYTGHGRGVTLSETGNLAGLIEHFFYKLKVYDRINTQIVDAARKAQSGNFQYSFIHSYSFIRYVFGFGDGVVSGEFSGSVKNENWMMYINGEESYQYTDHFTDVVDIRELWYGSSALTPTSPQWTEIGGTQFPIAGSWATSFKSEAKFDEDQSIFQYTDG
jgi:hypothetical protein